MDLSGKIRPLSLTLCDVTGKKEKIQTSVQRGEIRVLLDMCRMVEGKTDANALKNEKSARRRCVVQTKMT
jgi:hypothetical protein